jgi:hypothetical protein
MTIRLLGNIDKTYIDTIYLYYEEQDGGTDADINDGIYDQGVSGTGDPGSTLIATAAAAFDGSNEQIISGLGTLNTITTHQNPGGNAHFYVAFDFINLDLIDVSTMTVGCEVMSFEYGAVG